MWLSILPKVWEGGELKSSQKFLVIDRRHSIYFTALQRKHSKVSERHFNKIWGSDVILRTEKLRFLTLSISTPKYLFLIWTLLFFVFIVYQNHLFTSYNKNNLVSIYWKISSHGIRKIVTEKSDYYKLTVTKSDMFEASISRDPTDLSIIQVTTVARVTWSCEQMLSMTGVNEDIFNIGKFCNLLCDKNLWCFSIEFDATTNHASGLRIFAPCICRNAGI